ncbi:MAG: SRPBCC family protein [Sphingomicrobium sp.]
MTEAATQIRLPVQKVAPDAIRLERLLDAPVETVWRYLTEAELRRQWFMGGTDATPGSEFELLNDHDNLSDEPAPYPENYAEFKGRTWSEKVLRFDPPHVLETTFQGGKNGKVTFELFPEGGKTRLVLTHSGIESPVGAQDFGSGWNSHLAVLQKRLAGEGVPNFWALHARSREEVLEALESQD